MIGGLEQVARVVEMATSAASSGGQLDREEIDARYKWSLEDIYPGWESWEADLEVISGQMDELVEMQGTLEQGGEQLLRFYRSADRMEMLAYKLFRYPQLQYDIDQRDNAMQARLQRVQSMFAQLQVRLAWVNPELVELGAERVEGWIEQTEGLEDYRFPIMEVFRSQEHLLDEAGERLLSLNSRFNSTPGEIFRALHTADQQFNEIELSSGESVKVSYGEYKRILETVHVQADRRAAFESLYELFWDKRNTYAAIYSALCQRDWARAQARNFTSCAEAALHGNNVPVEVLQTLMETTRAGTAPLRRYHKLRKEAIGLESYHLYDGRVPILELDQRYDYDEACQTVRESVAPLGQDYQQKLAQATSNGWLDVFETEGKRSGAYSAGVYGVHPYMLLNYNGTLGDVFTLAHELGHTLHTLLSHETQPFATAHYTIFVAEVASTLNEALLHDHMMNKLSDPRERIVLLERAIEGLCGTFFTQVMFANFEYSAHEMAEQGAPMTAEALNAIYRGLLEDYYGEAMELEDYNTVTWARIPHFYSPYYVYQYATSYAASSQIVQRIQAGDTSALEAYLTLLKSGGDDHPMDQLRRAGVDLSEPTAVEAVIARLDHMIDDLEEALDELED